MYLFKETIMKKALLAAIVFLTIGITGAYACQTTTVIVNGKMTTCTICGNVVSCF
jgi:hypothetical protein